MRITFSPKILFIFGFLMIASQAIASDPAPVAMNAESRAVQLQTRLEEIKAIDKSTISSAERKALRREVRAIKKELAAISGGVYLSVGALILIALLLILLL